MLILSRKPGEKITIGDSITVVVSSIRGNVVRLGVVAPKDVKVHRKEVALRIAEEKAAGVMEQQPLGGVP